MLQIDESSSGRTVSLQIGQTVEIGLSETPSTGFRWSLIAEGEPACTLISDSFEPGVKRRLGKRAFIAGNFKRPPRRKERLSCTPTEAGKNRQSRQQCSP